MRIYISGPMTGTCDYAERFARAEQELIKDGYSVVNPARMDEALPKDMTYEEHMKIDIELLDMCDAIYMMEGWEKSCGANREYGYALAKDMVIMIRDSRHTLTPSLLSSGHSGAYAGVSGHGPSSPPLPAAAPFYRSVSGSNPPVRNSHSGSSRTPVLPSGGIEGSGC